MWGDFLANMGVDGDAAGLGGRLFHIRVRSFSYTLSALDGHCWLVLYFWKLSCNVRPYQTERSRTAEHRIQEMPEGLFCVSHGRLLKSKNGYFYKAFGMCLCFRKSFLELYFGRDAWEFVIEKA